MKYIISILSDPAFFKTFIGFVAMALALLVVVNTPGCDNAAYSLFDIGVQR